MARENQIPIGYQKNEEVRDREREGRRRERGKEEKAAMSLASTAAHSILTAKVRTSTCLGSSFSTRIVQVLWGPSLDYWGGGLFLKTQTMLGDRVGVYLELGVEGVAHETPKADNV